MEKAPYLATIGLEIHAELQTASKMFCSCKNDPDEDRPNVNICPICLGHPGTLPVINAEAVMHVLRVGLAIGGTVADFTEWDRKNYFYPDIPKGYQISQYKYPLITNGMLAGVEIERIHLEEDTAQSTHDAHEKSLINFNRAGVPLMELVTKPVIHDAATAVRFAKELQLLLRTLGAGRANMEKGEMRVEANISIASATDTAAKKFGTKTEVKNLNSFRSVEHAVEHELARQSSLLEHGEVVIQETRGFDDRTGETYSQRSKESSHDYRYFPDPDIPKVKISDINSLDTETLKKELPELPWIKRDRLKSAYGMTDKEAAVLVESLPIAQYFEDVIAPFKEDKKKVKLSTNYLLTDYLGLVKDEDKISIIPATSFGTLISMIADNIISSRGAKDLFAHLVKNPTSSPEKLANELGLIQKSDATILAPAIDKVLSENTKAVSEYKAGKTASIQFIIGQVMKVTKGAANPEVVRKILIEKLG